MNEWDESKHPRDKIGRFADGAGGEHIPTQAEKERLHEIGIDDKPQLSRQEYAVLRAEVMRKNAAQRGKVKPTNFAFTADYFYIYSTTGDDSFMVIVQLDIETKQDKIEEILRRLQ